jgi:uncharacterized protein YndB with AHSA1/START domain
MVELRASVTVNAPPARVFAALTDWERQEEWIPGTRVTVVKGDGDAVGDEFVARTSWHGVGFDDPMRITVWQPPFRCEVAHLGRVVRGAGLFEVTPEPAGGARYTWVEWIEPPLGLAGQAGLRLGRRPAEFALRMALRRFANWVEQDQAMPVSGR